MLKRLFKREASPGLAITFWGLRGRWGRGAHVYDTPHFGFWGLIAHERGNLSWLLDPPSAQSEGASLRNVKVIRLKITGELR